MYHKQFSAAGLILLLAAAAAPANTLVVNTLADDSNLSCATTCTLRDAIALVGEANATITFDPALLPGTITLNQALSIPAKPLTIVGPGAALLAIDGNFADRIFVVGVPGPAFLPVRISDLSLINGRTVAGDGAPGAAATGDAGQTASGAGGGCILVQRGVLTLTGVTLRNCTAQGGVGGSGGSGTPNDVKAGGGGGTGGNGGVSEGGAIYARSGAQVVLWQTSIVDAHAIGGSGGKGGDGGIGIFLGPGGNGGQGGAARGGAIYLEHSISLQAINVTIAQSSAQGGKGGNGGGGDPDFANSAGGDGGDGGNALGGLVFGQLTFPSFARFGFATLGDGVVTGGLHGSGGRGATRGDPGNDGSVAGAALNLTPSGLATAEHSAIFGLVAGLCAVAMNAPTSLVADGSCGGMVALSLRDWFAPLQVESAVPAYFPRFQGGAVDSTFCLMTQTSPEFPNPTIGTDVQGTPRPQGAACDHGAIETDYVFAGDFE